MAVGMMEINRSDSDELRISKINSNFKALIGCLSKGMTGFTVAGQGYGYYNALRDRLEVDNAYIDNLSTYLMQAKYASIGTAWIQNVSFQNAVAQNINVDTLSARLLTASMITSGKISTDFLNAVVLNATSGTFQTILTREIDTTWITARTGFFDAIFAPSIQSQYINASYIKTGTLEFDRLISEDEATGKKYFARVQEIEGVPQLVWDIQVDDTLVEDNSIGINQIVNILQGENGMINLGQGTFSFYKDNKTVLDWDGEKLLIALNSALIKFVDREDTDADKVASLVDQYTTLSGLDDRVTNVTNGLADSNDRIDVIENWLSIDDARLVIGRADQTGVATLTLTADAVTLNYDNSTATLTSKGLESNQALFKNSAKIGGFVWESRKGVIEHLSLKYIGEM